MCGLFFLRAVFTSHYSSHRDVYSGVSRGLLAWDAAATGCLLLDCPNGTIGPISLPHHVCDVTDLQQRRPGRWSGDGPLLRSWNDEVHLCGTEEQELLSGSNLLE